MKNKKCKSAAQKPQGFTLIELVLVIGCFSFISVLLMSNLSSTYRFKALLQDKKTLHFEASSILNNGVPGLIRSGFAINYDQTHASKNGELTLGMQEDVDQLSIFTDQSESQYFTIFRKPYQAEGVQADTAGLYIQFNDTPEIPLHSSQVVVEDFKIFVPTDPRQGGDRDIQPYVELYMRLRKRVDVPGRSEDPIYTSYSTTIALRNAGPASYKNPIQP